MRLTPENKLKVTQAIRAGAAKTFRQRGYDAVNLDMLMKEAGLTRGAFYAHYTSKAELFADVMRNEHPLLRMLKRRTATSGAELHSGMLSVFDGYLDPSNLDAVFEGCSLAALTGDATRAEPAVRKAFGEAFMSICAEMARGQGFSFDAYCPALSFAAGSVRTAKAMAEDQMRDSFLSLASSTFRQILPTPTSKETENDE